MQAGQETFNHDAIGDTIREFERWRASRPRGARIPATLWRSATALAAVHGVSKTATALGLDYYALKKRLGDRSARASPAVEDPDPVPGFVEVSLPSTTSTFACTIEVEKLEGDAGHSKLRLELEDMALTDLDALLRSLWSRRA